MDLQPHLHSETVVAVIDYLLGKHQQTKSHMDQSSRTPAIVNVSLSELEEEGITIEDARLVLQFLHGKGCFPIQFEKRRSHFFDMAQIDELHEGLFSTEKPPIACLLTLEDISCIKLFELKLQAQGKTGQSIIKPIALEHIARRMGDSGNASSLIKLLNECGVPECLIVYPNTKWRMIDDVFRILATSTDEKDHQLLFSILEEFCHPLRYGGDKERALEIQDSIADLICFDNYYFVNGHIKKNDSDDPKELMWISDMEAAREERKKERQKVSAAGLAAMSQLFQGYSPSQHQRQKQQATSVAQQHNPVQVVIHNQNIQQSPIVSGSADPHRNQKPEAHEMCVNELAIDLKGRALRNMHTGKEKDITGVNYAFLKALIDAQGALVTYEALAEALRSNTVKKLTEKEVMDVRSKFIKMLREELQISEVTCDEVIQGKDGYRISRKIYENNQKKI